MLEAGGRSKGHVSKGVGVLAGHDAGAHAPERPIIEGMLWSENDNFCMCLPNIAEIQEWTVKRDLGCMQFVGHAEAVLGIVIVTQEELGVMRGGRGEAGSAGHGGVAETTARFKPEESAVFRCAREEGVVSWCSISTRRRRRQRGEPPRTFARP